MSTGQPFVQSPFLEIIVTGVVTGALLIPLALVGGLVGERVGRRDEVTREVSAMWGRRQTTGAIVLTVPYDETRRVANGVETIVREAHFLPDVLAIDAEVVPEVRARSIFKVVVYRARTHLRRPVRQAESGAARRHARACPLGPGARVRRSACQTSAA